MKSKIRLLWMKLHAYFACFFLPITLVYLTTGLLYFFGFEGEVTSEKSYTIQLAEGWPKTEEIAFPIMITALADDQEVDIPADYYLYKGAHYWYGYQRELKLTETDDPSVAQLTLKEHDLLMQLLIIHKGYGGLYFKVLSIFFGFSLAFSVISGVVITLQLPQLKKASMLGIAVGAMVLLAGFI